MPSLLSVALMKNSLNHALRRWHVITHTFRKIHPHNATGILSVSALLMTSLFADNGFAKPLPKCGYIASYSTEYSWQRSLENGLLPTLKNACDTHIFYMDAKKIHRASTLAQKGLEAKQFIDKLNPALVIFSDDDAVREVLINYYKDSDIPAVFCGINDSATNYGLPFANTTGMTEKSNFQHALETLSKMQPFSNKIAYVTGYGRSEMKNGENFGKAAKALGLKSDVIHLHNEQEWETTYKRINQSHDIDMIVLDSFQSIDHWDSTKNLTFIPQYQTKPLISFNAWMLPYVNLGFIKSAEEQGRWAAMSAIEILDGVHPSEIPIVPNQQFDYWVNQNTFTQFPQLKVSEEFQVYQPPTEQP